MEAQPSEVRDAAARLVAAAEAGRLDELFERHGVLAAFLFGSAVEPDASGPGDVDVAVWCGGHGPADHVGLVTGLTAAAAWQDVDLAVLDRASVVLRAAAVCGHGLYEAEPGVVASLQMRFLPELWDTAWLRELQLDVLAER